MLFIMLDNFQIKRIGVIKKQGETVAIEIHDEYKGGLLGLDQFSHIAVFYWFQNNDTIENRKVLQVHPRGNKKNPLTGVFATRSPKRPNLIGMSVCKILSIDETIIHIEKIDAFNGTPVIDIKPYMPAIDTVSNANTPGWVP